MNYARLTIAIFVLILLPATARGQSEVLLSERISKTELASGYSISSSNGDINIEIKPNALNRSAFIELLKPEFYPITPLDKSTISNIYHYSILPATDNKLSGTISITLKYPDTETRYREIYIYNQTLKQWDNVPGSINLEQNTLAIETNLASGFIAAFADHLERNEYLKDDITAPSILVVDNETGEILVERNSNVKRSVASLTKLMTASTFLENNPGWDSKVVMQASDDTIPAKIYVKPGDTFKARDIFYATLLRSANNAAKALARSTGLSRENFVANMNQKAARLHMENTEFVEPTGLADENISTAEDMYKLARHVFADLTFLQATTPKSFTIASVNNGKRHIMRNTNKAIDVPFVVIGSKTGYTHEAGRCLIMKARNKDGREVIAVTLGGEVPGEQWDDMRELLGAALGS